MPVGIQHQPLRTCIATREVLPSQQLLRCVADRRNDGSVVIVPDPQRNRPGRGAWITPTEEAWQIAEKRRAFARALKVSGLVADTEPVRNYIVQLHGNVE
ncbi:MAG TPA: YlxR family protein [Candidatus Corynebacterium gallistercoris]|uniref:YlxR family protein n=1 Tax=Candidatus Corynebacterium gallistercoris TaxID=2838530 RepID=A0A9D1RWK5_9CORY|nr:YlxR family protein [Candidatus Corynebacterium gallistercoris]